MKNYELTVLFHPDLEMNLDPALKKVKDTITANGGKITKEENDGKKRLSYAIKKQDFAIYYYFDLDLPTDALTKISSAFNISDEVLRYLLVRADGRRAKLAAKKEENNSNQENNQEKED